MPNYGIIDLGSNTVRLCVYRTHHGDKKSADDRGFRSILNNRVVAGLSAYIENGVFTQQGIERTLTVLKGHHKRLKYFECERTDVFATAVLRNCLNSKEVVKELEERSGFSIAILSGQDEAHLGFVGATCEGSIDKGTLIDIGGGSTELSAVIENDDVYHSSIKQGSLSSFATCVESILPTQIEIDRMIEMLDTNISFIPDKKYYRNAQFFGIGGSLRAASKAFALLFPDWDASSYFTPTLFHSFFNLYRKEPNTVAHAILKTVPERIHTLIPGCLIAYRLMDIFDAKTLTLMKKGVREGYLIERILHGGKST